jgi:transcription termination factor NusB
MNALKRFWNWLLGKTTIDEKIIETYQDVKEEVQEKIEDVKEYVDNVVAETQDVVSAIKGKVTKSKLRTLTKTQLIAEAKDVFGVELDPKDNKTTLINKVYNLHHKK